MRRECGVRSQEAGDDFEQERFAWSLGFVDATLPDVGGGLREGTEHGEDRGLEPPRRSHAGSVHLQSELERLIRRCAGHEELKRQGLARAFDLREQMDLGLFGYPRGMSHRIGEFGGPTLNAVASPTPWPRSSPSQRRLATTEGLQTRYASLRQRPLAVLDFRSTGAETRAAAIREEGCVIDMVRKVMTRGRILALGTAVVVALIAALGATATPPGRNGLIVYAQELRPEHYQLFTIRPDGSAAKQITHLFSAANPDWSPNGKTIVAGVESKSAAGISLLSSTGTVIRNLTPAGDQGQPSFSPDGKWIVYERDIARGNNGVWLMRSNGAALRRVTRNPFGEVSVAATPTRISLPTES